MAGWSPWAESGQSLGEESAVEQCHYGLLSPSGPAVPPYHSTHRMPGPQGWRASSVLWNLAEVLHGVGRRQLQGRTPDSDGWRSSAFICRIHCDFFPTRLGLTKGSAAKRGSNCRSNPGLCCGDIKVGFGEGPQPLQPPRLMPEGSGEDSVLSSIPSSPG